MIYVVAGYIRSGTTAMMHAIEAGGIPLTYDQKAGTPANRMREPTREMIHEYGFPTMHPGTCVKLLYLGLAPTMSALTYALSPYSGGYHVAFLWRHPWEIRKSFEEDLWPRQQMHTKLPWVTQAGQYEQAMVMMRSHYRNRRDLLSLTELQYRPNYRADLPALLTEPEACFDALADAGWPLDVARAAAVIDPDRCAWKAEQIEEAA